MTRAGVLLVAGAMASAGAACSRSASNADSKSRTADAAAASASALASAFPTADPLSVPLAAPAPTLPARPVAKIAFVEVEPWLATRGVAMTSALQMQLLGCSAFTVAAPARDGLWCTGGPLMKGSLPGGESLFPLTVWLVHGHELRLALEAPIAAGALDQEAPPAPGDVNEGMYIHLAATLEPSGTALEIRERPGAECARIVATLAERGLPTHRKVVEIACRSRGRYVLRNGQFVRTS